MLYFYRYEKFINREDIFMSKFKKHGMVTLFICLCLSAGGCGRHTYVASQHASAEDSVQQHSTGGQNSSHEQGSSHGKDDSNGNTDTSGQDNAIPGSYTVPDGWVEASEHSTEDKIFYVEDGHEHDAMPDNISINVGENRYAADEHEDFRQAILSQLAMQIGNSGASVDGYGTTTDQGDVEYVFTITAKDSSVTRQYYIVGDHRYCLIQLTNFTGSDSVNDAADEMAASYTWD